MSEYARFTLKDCTFIAQLPEREPWEWTLQVFKDQINQEEVKIPMDYPPIFGPDVVDVAALEAKTEELIKKYQLE